MAHLAPPLPARCHDLLDGIGEFSLPFLVSKEVSRCALLVRRHCWLSLGGSVQMLRFMNELQSSACDQEMLQ